jgi:hypothetical protein
MRDKTIDRLTGAAPQAMLRPMRKAVSRGNTCIIRMLKEETKMKLVINNSALVLDRWETVELVDAAGATATIDQGCVWLTMEKDRRDIVLGSGQSFKVAKNGRTLLHAEAPTTLRIAGRPARHVVSDVLRRVRATIDGWAVRSLETRHPVPYY